MVGIEAPVLNHLVLDDLHRMSQTGRYRAQVLLDMQDEYVRPCLEARLVAGGAFEPVGSQNDVLDWLERETQSAYIASKAEGRRADLDGCLRKAGDIATRQAKTCALHLQTIHALADVVFTADSLDCRRLDQLAHEGFSCMASAAFALERAEELAIPSVVSQVRYWLRRGIEVGSASGGSEGACAQALLRRIEQLAALPLQTPAPTESVEADSAVFGVDF